MSSEVERWCAAPGPPSRDPRGTFRAGYGPPSVTSGSALLRLQLRRASKPRSFVSGPSCCRHERQVPFDVDRQLARQAGPGPAHAPSLVFVRDVPVGAGYG